MSLDLLHYFDIEMPNELKGKLWQCFLQRNFVVNLPTQKEEKGEDIHVVIMDNQGF